MPSTTKKKCSKRGCPHAAIKRGMCGTHYQQVWRLVARGQSTWDEHVVLGHCLTKVRLSAATKKMLADVAQLRNK